MLNLLTVNNEIILSKKYLGVRSSIRALNEMGARNEYGQVIGYEMVIQSQDSSSQDQTEKYFRFIPGTALGHGLAGNPILELSVKWVICEFIVALKSLWSIKTSKCGYYIFVSEGVVHWERWSDFIAEDLTRLHLQLRNSKCQAEYGACVLLDLCNLRSLAISLVSPDSFCVCHGDPIFDNAILVSAQEAVILIDLEYATEEEYQSGI